MTEADAVDHAWLLAGVATAHWLLGDADQAPAYARAAGARATIASDPLVQAAAHIAMALAVSLGGDPATVEGEYARAAACATEAGDQVQLARIGANRSHHLLADARFAEAVDVAAAAGAAAEKFGSAVLLAVALGNEAEGLLRLGRNDDALNRCERALALAGQIGTRRTAGAWSVWLRSIYAAGPANRLGRLSRTTLTVVAIFIGAFTLTLTNGVGNGVNAYIDSTVSALGATDVLTVTKTQGEPGDGPQKYDPNTSFHQQW